MTNEERKIVNHLLRGAFNILRVNKDKHAQEIETVIRSIESDYWEEGYVPVRQSANSGNLGI
jgi:hypothetical protein